MSRSHSKVVTSSGLNLKEDKQGADIEVVEIDRFLDFQIAELLLSQGTLSNKNHANH